MKLKEKLIPGILISPLGIKKTQGYSRGIPGI
jgi:hypothetical protein